MFVGIGLAGAHVTAVVTVVVVVRGQEVVLQYVRHHLDETLAGMAVTGERVWHSEFHRLRGELLLACSSWNQEAAEACFCQAIEIAHAQAARAWELRAATSMALFLARHNRADEGRRMLGELYSSFAESPVDTADLRDAKRLLDEVLILKT